MTDDLRTRMIAVAEDHDVEQEGVNYWQCTCGDKFYLSQDKYRSWQEHLADAVIRELGQRRCERCRHYVPVDQFPLPYEGSDQMRPFCIPCTDYIEWATS